MPLPKTNDVGTVISFLNREKPGMARKQKIAIALHQTGKSKKTYTSDQVKMAKKMA